MKKFRDQDIQTIKNSLLTESDLTWLKNQIKNLSEFITQKNKCRQKESLQLSVTIEKIISSGASLALRTYTSLAEIQHYYRVACGKSHAFWSLFYRDLCDQKIARMEQNKEHHTFARGLATILQMIDETVPNLFVTKISESGKKELTATLAIIDHALPSKKEIISAKNTLNSTV